MREDGTFKHRVILDLRANSVNAAAQTPERQVLPTVHQHARDLALLGEFAGADPTVELWTVILDIRDAFMGIPLHPEEFTFNTCAADFPLTRTRPALYQNEPEIGRYIVWAVLGFGGKPNPLVFARAASFASRCAQALLPRKPCTYAGSALAAGRLQLYVDDPIATFAGSAAACQCSADLVILFWMTLGLPLAWSKGSYTNEGHAWIGAEFSTRLLEDRPAGVVSVPEKIADDLHKALSPMAKGQGHLADADVQKTLGKAGRLSFLVPSARPFVTSLWGALAGSQAAARAGKREAPPHRHAARRFREAAGWIQTLLRPPAGKVPLMPLEHLVVTSSAPISATGPAIQFDASPWGCGAILSKGGVPQETLIVTWDDATAARLGTKIGSPDGQTSWEYLALLLSLICWGHLWRDSGLAIFGDNVAALSGAANLRGRGVLSKITRELAWRRVRFGWRYAVSHLPAEENEWADALSRLAAPAGSDHKQMPEPLRGVARAVAPDWADVWACG